MRRKTHEEFVEELEEKQPELFKEIKIVGKYKNAISKVLIDTKYGLCNMSPDALLNGRTPSIRSAVDKSNYFINMLKSEQPCLYNEIDILSKYKDGRTKILFRDKYGICEMRPNNLLRGQMPSILSSIDKTNYFINMAKEKPFSEKYLYDEVEYVGSKTPVRIKCKKHGHFYVRPFRHLRGVRCKKCVAESNNGFSMERWVASASSSKNFSCFKLYKIRCWNENEEFYKIGITFLSIKNRFSGNSMPYSYEIIDIIESDDGEYIWKLEKELHNLNKNNKYVPNIGFHGMYECFKKLN